MVFKRTKKSAVILLIISMGIISWFTTLFFRFPISFLWNVANKTHMYGILNIVSDVNITTIEKEYDKINCGSYKNKEEYLKGILNVAAYTAVEKKYDKDYYSAVIYYEFINDKLKKYISTLPEETDVSIILELWECYLSLDRFDDFINDYEFKENEIGDKNWNLINTSLVIYLTVDETCIIQKEKKCLYLIWLKEKMDNKLKNTDKNSTTYTAFSRLINEYIEPFLAE